MSAIVAPAPNTTTEVLGYVQEAVAAVATLEAARDLGLLDRLRNGAIETTEVVRDCRISERAADTLLVALSGIGIVAPSGHGRYAPALDAAVVSALLGAWQPLIQVLRALRHS